MKKASENVQITSDGIKNSLKRYEPLQALAEYVWNGFDACATNINIKISEGLLEGTETISISDNGYGIDLALLKSKFRPFYKSEKIYDPTLKHSATHGKNGVGRFTFFTFANLATWETSYARDGKIFTYSIDINAADLEHYWPSEEYASETETGTTVTFSDLQTTEITQEVVYQYLAHEFCWFLELNKSRNFSIVINEKKLCYENYVLQRDVQSYSFSDKPILFEVRYVCWKIKLNDYSKYYYIKSDGLEVAKENTSLNNKGDRFYHRVC